MLGLQRRLGRRNVRIALILGENTSGAGSHRTRAPEAKEKTEETCLLRKLGHHGPHLRQGSPGGGGGGGRSVEHTAEMGKLCSFRLSRHMQMLVGLMKSTTELTMACVAFCLPLTQPVSSNYLGPVDSSPALDFLLSL